MLHTEDNFLIIGITTPDQSADIRNESFSISQYLKSGAVDSFHIRKPDSDLSYVRSLISAIPSELHSLLVLHSHFHLFDQYNFGGIHYKSENDGFMLEDKIISRSCHSVLECNINSQLFTYSFLSPIFDSISKEGYKSKFSLKDETLLDTIGRWPVIALGGVSPEDFEILYEAKFAGAALLGYLWNSKLTLEAKINSLLSGRQKLIKHK